MKRTLTWKLSLALAAISAAALGAPPPESPAPPRAEPVPQQEPVKSTQLTPADLRFVQEAATVGNREVKLAQLALTRATDLQVKRYAQMLVDDLTTLNDELKAICANKPEVQLPSEELSGEAKKSYDQLSGLGADRFDREFVKVMIGSHTGALRPFEKAGRSAEAPELKAFAIKYLPSLARHLAQAQTLERNLKPQM